MVNLCRNIRDALNGESLSDKKNGAGASKSTLSNLFDLREWSEIGEAIALHGPGSAGMCTKSNVFMGQPQRLCDVGVGTEQLA